jgi:tetratricopeptide (TPR) repeat protein
MSAPKRDPFDLCGTTIDAKYRVIDVVGEGGFGVVYRGLHEGFDSPVAIKCLKLPSHLGPAEQEALVHSLRDEGRLLRRLSQRTPGIVQAHDVGALSTRLGARVPYLVLEWLDGRTLADELRRSGARPVAEAIRLLGPAARALAVAHQENVAHRDIKPENLFLVDVGGQATLKVLDFGIAKIFAEAPSSAAEAMTGDGPRAFTPAYAAPEQFDKRRGATGPWTDVYALGLVLVEVASGRRAQVGDDFASLFTASIDPVRRPTLRACGAAASDAVERVVERALAVEPTHRFADAGAFWAALEAADALTGTDGALTGPADALAGTLLASSGGELATGAFVAEHGIVISGSTKAGADPGEPGQPARAGPAPVASETAPSAALSAPHSGPPATTRGGVSATAERPAPRRRSMAWGAAGALVLAAAAAVWFFGLRDRALPGGPASPASASSPLVDKTGESANAEAQSLFKDALQAWFDGALEVAVRSMEKASSLDPGFGAAELRLALWKFEKKPAEGRDHFQAAQLHRASLSAKDQGLLHASEAYLRDPWDLEAWTTRLEALVEKYPEDPELLIDLGLSNHVRLRMDAAVAAYDRALHKNPGLVGAWVLMADSLSMKGDVAGQLAAYEACLKTSPMAGQCLSRQLVTRGRMGQCDAMREDAKRLLSLSPKSAGTQRQLAIALFATGAPRDGVTEALARGWGLLPDDERAASECEDKAALAMLDGDFGGAERALLDWAVAVKAKTNQTPQAEPALELASLYEEMGDPRKAGSVADSFVRRMGALSEPLAGDWTMAFLPYRLHAGLIKEDDYARERAAWAERVRLKWKNAGRRLDEDLDWITWLNAYGGVVRSEADAREAVQQMPKKISVAVESGRYSAMDLAIGRAHALGGDAAAALRPLLRASQSCLALVDPSVPATVHLYLGLALEKTGDAAGARAAYEKVIALWGKARPRSVTAAKARALLAKLPTGK